jgi:hypothetical protein
MTAEAALGPCERLAEAAHRHTRYADYRTVHAWGMLRIFRELSASPVSAPRLRRAMTEPLPEPTRPITDPDLTPRWS